jgi:LysM repeat protein
MQHRLIGLTLAAAFAGVLAIGPSLATPATAHDRSVVVHPGDTLTALAQRYGISVQQLVAFNHLPDANRIYAGQRLLLQAPADASSAPPVAAPAARVVVHAVRPGEHLTGIARTYGTTIQAIAAANAIANPSYIRSGQRLVIPTRAAAAPPPTAAPTAAPTAPAAPAPAAFRTHRVASGEHLTGIARSYGTTIQAIVSANGIANPRYIRAGQVLRIPTSAATPSASVNQALPASIAALAAARGDVRRRIIAEAPRFGVPPALALAVAWQESGWRQNVVSHAGAVGVMQLLPATGDWIGQVMLGQRVDVHDRASNVRAGVRLLAHYLDRYRGDRAKALAAYYQGQTAVDRHGIYPVSRPYIASVLRLEQLFG